MEIEKVNTDKRGEIWKIESEKVVYFLAKTNKGFARGGDIHDGEQYTLILEGKMEVRFQYPDKETTRILGENQMAIAPPEVPHVFIALEDTLFLEWHEKPLPPFEKKRYYEPYRRLCK